MISTLFGFLFRSFGTDKYRLIGFILWVEMVVEVGLYAAEVSVLCVILVMLSKECLYSFLSVRCQPHRTVRCHSLRGESSRVRGKRGLERVTIESWRATTRV